jgi:malonate transporter
VPAGIAVNALPFGIYPPFEQAVDLIARSSLGLGLLMVGAGLKLTDALRPGPAVAATALKLVAFPVIMVALALGFGPQGRDGD